LGAIGFIIAIIVLSQTGESLGWGWFNNSSGADNVGFIVLAVLIIGIIIAVATSGGEANTNPEKGKASYTVFREK